MRFQIWHKVNPNFQNYNPASPAFPAGYEKVAVVECVNLQHAYAATQHIDQDWLTNPEVIEKTVNPIRSTSVGDVVVDDKGNQFYCQMVGWERINQVA